jgi:Fur family ferric uptake transcriptional regulator
VVIVENITPEYHTDMAPLADSTSSKIRRNTQQRREIREVFERNNRPLASDEVLRLAQQRIAGLGMATVYRTIKTLTDEGWLVPVEVPGGPPRYEVRGKAHHHHFHCLKCGKLFELDRCLERVVKLIPPSFRVVDHVVMIYGYCASCDRRPKIKQTAVRRNAAYHV